jgi:hypothetical protein
MVGHQSPHHLICTHPLQLSNDDDAKQDVLSVFAACLLYGCRKGSYIGFYIQSPPTPKAPGQIPAAAAKSDNDDSDPGNYYDSFFC